MKQLCAAAIALMGLATPAFADGNGVVSAFSVPDGVVDVLPCAFFQTNGGPTWYAVPIADGHSGILFAAEVAMLQTLRTTGINMTFLLNGNVCGYPRAYDIQQ